MRERGKKDEEGAEEDEGRGLGRKKGGRTVESGEEDENRMEERAIAVPGRGKWAGIRVRERASSPPPQINGKATLLLSLPPSLPPFPTSIGWGSSPPWRPRAEYLLGRGGRGNC